METGSMETMVVVDPEADRSSLIGDVVLAIGDVHFAQTLLLALARWLPVGSCSVYELWPDRLPQLHGSAAQGRADSTMSCFTAYREAGLYRDDRSFEAVRAQRPGVPVLLHLRAEDMPNPMHRAAIYERYDMAERVSLAWCTESGSLLALNLYRHGQQQAMGHEAIVNLIPCATLLRAAVHRHVALGAPMLPAACATPAESLRDRLRQRCPALTGRELDVLERLLAGMTYDGIAADTGLSLSSVKTYRERAFRRLGLHFRNQLFAWIGGQG